MSTATNTDSNAYTSLTQTTENLGSPSTQSRRATRPTPATPWTRIVRGESESIAAAGGRRSLPVDQPQSFSASVPEAERLENYDGAHGCAGMRSAWNRPSNGTSATATEAGPVMGAAAWPALSESNRASSDRSSSDSLRSMSEGSSPSSSSVAVSQGIETAFASTQRQIYSNTNSNSMPNHLRQTSFRHNDMSSSSNGSSTQLSAQATIAEVPLHNPSPRGHNQRNGFVSRPHGGSDNQQRRNSFRGQNGNYHQNHGGRRNQDHGNHNLNSNRNFNGRDGHVQPQRVVPAFMRPPPPPISAPFIHAPAMQPFGSPMGFSELPPSIYYPPPALRGVPFIAPIPAPMFYPLPEPGLFSRILDQIHFYFSDENLIKDTYLRQNMDEQGWVSIDLISKFRMVKALTDDAQLILDALQSSSVLEVQGNKIRKRNDWMRWLIPPSLQIPNVSSPQSAERLDHNTLATHVQNISLVQAEASTSGSSSGDLSTQLQPLRDDTAGQVSGSASSTPPSNSN